MIEEYMINKNKKWIKTVQLTDIFTKRLGEITQEEAIRDGFENEFDCIWGLLEINNFLWKRPKPREKIKERLDYALKLLVVFYQWKPLNEELDLKNKYPSINCSHFIPKILDCSKTQTIRFFLKKLTPGQKIYLVQIIKKKAIRDKNQTDLRSFLNGEKR